jgi:hypothetical protein
MEVDASLLRVMAEHCLDNGFSQVAIERNVKGAYKLTALRKFNGRVSHFVYDEPSEWSNYPDLDRRTQQGTVRVDMDSLEGVFKTP